jgi:hypothetical protein
MTPTTSKLSIFGKLLEAFLLTGETVATVAIHSPAGLMYLNLAEELVPELIGVFMTAAPAQAPAPAQPAPIALVPSATGNGYITGLATSGVFTVTPTASSITPTASSI